MTVITLRGTHGTATEFAAAIGASGFKPSETGRAGGGVYLWAYVSDEDHAIALAEDWWQQQFDKGAYRGLRRAERAVLICEIEVDLEAGEYVNLNQTHVHDELRERFAKGRNCPIPCE